MNTPLSESLAQRRLVGDLALATLLAVAGTTWLSWLMADHQTTTSGLLLDSAGMLAITLPLVMVAFVVPLNVMRDRLPEQPPLPVVLLATAPGVALAISVAHQAHRVFLDEHPATVSLGGLMGDADSLLVVVVPATLALLWMRQVGPAPLLRRWPAALAVVVAMNTAALTATLAPGASGSTLDGTSCLSGGQVDKSFDVTSLNVDIPVNRFGDHDPGGKMYALTRRIADVRAQEASQLVSAGLRDDAIQPLVIRANQGECIEIAYTNSATGGDFGLHIDGLEFGVSSSGDSIGANPSSAVPLGSTTTYRFSIPDDRRLEGAHYIHPGPGYRSAVDHGLFGSLVVEPPGSTYWNASTPGQPLLSGWEAIIKPLGVDVPCDPTSTPASCAFRETALLNHEIGNDNEQLTAKNGLPVPLVDDVTGSYRPGSFALNYRSEPFRNRLLAFPKEKAHAYSSFTFGEPATPIMRGYLGDPTKIRLVHAGAEKFHVYHLHGGGDRWRFNPVADSTFNYADTGLRKDPATTESPSQRLDSQSIGPGESYNLEIEGGAGGVQQSAGDFLFHCHIAKHYTSGMWGLWRTYDTRQPDLVPLGDRAAPPNAVDSRGLLGTTVNGTQITKDNIDAWVRAQLPPAGVPRNAQDATRWDWKVAGTSAAPLYLGAPADPTVFPDSPSVLPGQPNLLAVDAGRLVGNRPAILFNPLNGRPTYPMLRTKIGKRPPFTAAGHTGSPWLGASANAQESRATDPWARRDDGLCPQGRRLRTFNVVAIGKPIRRTPTFVDPEGKIFVLAHDKAATLADPTKGEPLAIRSNQGDCVAITLTNEIPDASAFDKFSKTSMHIHHVQFDVQGSDGVSAGFAYEHSVRPYKTNDPTLLAGARKGDTVLRLSDVTKFLGNDANGQPVRSWLAVGEGLESIDIHQVQSVDPVARTVTLTTGLDADHNVGEFAGTEFIQYGWYPDVVLDNVFWHDHVDGIHGWGHGLVGQLIVEPAGSSYHDPVTGDEVDSGTLVDIHTSSTLSPGLVNGSFRELALWTINDNDKADYSTLNLRANPLAARLDKANQFSSWKYGDPITPLPRLYANDPLVVRAISVSPTVDTLHLQGARTMLEPRYTHPDASGSPVPEGTLIDTVHAGISEKFTLVFNGDPPVMRMRPGDYLYANGTQLRTQQGAWGIVRILPGRVPDLRPLPGVSMPSGTYDQPTMTGGAPPPASSPGDPCPSGAPTRRFDVSALDRSGTFNGARTAFVPNQDVAAVKNRTKEMSPLVLHVVAGECVTVNVTNLLTTPVSFSVGKLDREAGSGGVNIGFAPEQNIAPNATRRHVYYVPSDRIGIAPIADLAGATTLKQGLYGAVVVAPASRVDGRSTEFSDPVTQVARDVGAQVLVHAPGNTPEHYRDFTVMIADDDTAIGQDFMPYPTDARAGRSLVNYQAAPVGDGPTAFRDPGKVPWLTAYAGDPVLVHALISPGSENAHVFGLGGLTWPRDRFLDMSNLTSTQGMGPWETVDADVLGGAGGTAHQPGDYFYGDLRRPFTAVGVWGLQRVLDPQATCSILLVDGSTC